MSSPDLVGVWQVPLSSGVRTIEFEHGTATGKRIVRVDGKEIIRKDWMFKLVGDEAFDLDGTRCIIRVEPYGTFSYCYSFLVDGKSLASFTRQQSKTTSTWVVNDGDTNYRIVLDKNTLDIWVNGKIVDVTRNFVDEGTEMHFPLGNIPAYVKTVSSGDKREGLIYTLIANNEIVDPAE
ncbi:unnamed protein product [Bemisia tabaci]|uniref:Fas apoptotic inhibitory molecule 1 n=1 Tax=Bemisia tabaci TaxID=7038 RepID=A0A9P0F3P1_BEMTA|nr:unnamed protein product [Bemisia tabaci]